MDYGFITKNYRGLYAKRAVLTGVIDQVDWSALTWHLCGADAALTGLTGKSEPFASDRMARGSRREDGHRSGAGYGGAWRWLAGVGRHGRDGARPGTRRARGRAA